MKNAYTFGLTGGIGCGKSSVAEFLRNIGIFTLDADVLARNVVEKGTIVFDAIVQKLGSSIILADGTLNRKLLGKIAFNDSNILKFLEDLTHPEVAKLAQYEIYKAHSTGSRYVVYEHPLIAEKCIQNEFDAVIVVTAPQEMQVARIVKRNNISENEALARIAAQASNVERLAIANYVIDSSGTKEELEKNVNDVWQQILLHFP